MPSCTLQEMNACLVMEGTHHVAKEDSGKFWLLVYLQNLQGLEYWHRIWDLLVGLLS